MRTSVAEKERARMICIRQSRRKLGDEGVATVEFAMLAPVMIFGLFFGSIEVTDALMAQRYISRSTGMLADLTARTRLDNGVVRLDEDELEDIFTASDLVLSGYKIDAAALRVTAVARNTDDDGYEIVWSREYTQAGGALSTPTAPEMAPGADYTALGPNKILDEGVGLVQVGDHLVVAEISYAFQSNISQYVYDGIPMFVREIRLPREGRTIHLCDSTGACTDDP